MSQDNVTQETTAVCGAPESWGDSFGDFTLLNGCVGDAALKTVFKQSGNIVMFDLGRLDNLSYGECLSTTNAFLSHLHFDHIVGFDALLRATFPLNRPLKFVGPPGTARRLSYRMKGYLWNLAAPDQVDHTICEIAPDGTTTGFHLSNSNDFEPTPAELETEWCDKLNPSPFEKPVAFVGTVGDKVRVYSLTLDHAGTPSAAYACVTPARLKMRSERLGELGLRPGPWIAAFQKAYLDGELERTFAVGTQEMSTAELAEKLLDVKAPDKFCYTTDFGLTAENVERVLPFVDGVRSLLIESNFRDGQEEQAFANGHLTTRQAALIAAWAGAESFRTFHLSNAFSDCLDEVRQEAQSFFAEFRTLEKGVLREEIEKIVR